MLDVAQVLLQAAQSRVRRALGRKACEEHVETGSRFEHHLGLLS
jgi:hypothetical protein